MYKGARMMNKINQVVLYKQGQFEILDIMDVYRKGQYAMGRAVSVLSGKTMCRVETDNIYSGQWREI